MDKWDIIDLYYGFFHWELNRINDQWIWTFKKQFPPPHDEQWGIGETQETMSDQEDGFLDNYYIGDKNG